MPTTRSGIDIEVHLGPDEWNRSLRREALAGLTATSKVLSPTWLYDERGCALFDEITRLPEYYPTRAERSILQRRALDAAAITRADTLVELGAGTAEKTRLLLDAMSLSGLLRRYVPFDVAESTLRATAVAVAEEHPGLRVEGVVGDFRRHLGTIPTGGRRLIAFLGGTIGNLMPIERADMLRELADGMAPGDALLLGTDLVKDRARLVAAYDDRAGITAMFNKNVLAVLNRELGADFDLDRFDHVARFDDDEEWIEMRLRSRGAQTVNVPELELTLRFADGEDLRTEISAKFRPERVRDELDAAG
ncbi:MAG: L-histidine Nalpha-methyltransferase, partial [Actinomycetota bacterium]|nr:L-histidine Nalpha-methyltransferase [Actinomycetota bacterium]